MLANCQPAAITVQVVKSVYNIAESHNSRQPLDYNVSNI